MTDSKTSVDPADGAPTALVLAEEDDPAPAISPGRGTWVLDDLPDDQLMWLGRS